MKYLLSSNRFCLFLFVVFHASSATFGTHIRGGYIIARLLDSQNNTYEFTLIGYRDTESAIFFGAGTFDFGDGTELGSLVGFQTKAIELSPTLVREEFRIVHSYAQSGFYTASYTEENRNAGIANIDNSVATPFHVETSFSIDPFLGEVNTGEILGDPIFFAQRGESYCYNIPVDDTDGDEVRFYLEVPLQARDTVVEGYRLPNNFRFYSLIDNEDRNTIFQLDGITGTIKWDSPGDFFNLAGSECPIG